MQRDIVECRADTAGIQPSKDAVPFLAAVEQEIEYVTIVNTFRGDDRPPHRPRLLQILKGAEITIPEGPPSRRDVFRAFKLCAQDGRRDLAQQNRRSKIPPVLLI